MQLDSAEGAGGGKGWGSVGTNKGLRCPGPGISPGKICIPLRACSAYVGIGTRFGCSSGSSSTLGSPCGLEDMTEIRGAKGLSGQWRKKLVCLAGQR